MLCFLFLISLVSYQKKFINFQVHYGFKIWSLLLFLPCFKRKGRIFRFPLVKRSLLGISYSISFLHISYSLNFCIVLLIYLLYFRVICLLARVLPRMVALVFACGVAWVLACVAHGLWHARCMNTACTVEGVLACLLACVMARILGRAVAWVLTCVVHGRWRCGARTVARCGALMVACRGARKMVRHGARTVARMVQEFVLYAYCMCVLEN